VWPHDDAIAEARRTVLRINPINGLPETEQVDQPPAAPQPPTWAPDAPPITPSEPFLAGLAVSRDDLVERLGLPPAVADKAMAGADEDAVLAIAERHEGWVGLLRRVIEAGDFGAWRVFLQPEQRKYVERRYKGPFRLSGGAGTGRPWSWSTGPGPCTVSSGPTGSC
jgi:hypothetical protein